MLSSEGTRPTYDMNWLAVAKRRKSPASAAIVTALTTLMPRNACNALTNGANAVSCTNSSTCAVSRSTRSARSSTVFK